MYKTSVFCRVVRSYPSGPRDKYGALGNNALYVSSVPFVGAIENVRLYMKLWLIVLAGSETAKQLMRNDSMKRIKDKRPLT